MYSSHFEIQFKKDLFRGYIGGISFIFLIEWNENIMDSRPVEDINCARGQLDNIKDFTMIMF